MSQRQNDRPDRGRAVSFWLAHEDIRALKTIAQEKGIGHTTLVRMWVKERLKYAGVIIEYKDPNLHILRRDTLQGRGSPR